MPGSGTRTFLEPDGYEASLRQAQIGIVLTPCGSFRARLTWAELHSVQVLRCEEEVPRVGFLTLSQQLCFVTFPTKSVRLPLWRGTELQPNDILLHGGGHQAHQTTFGPCVWSALALDPLQLERYGSALSGRSFARPTAGQILRPVPHDAARLRRVHGRICRLAETKPKILSHSEVARALEQDLIQALVACLTGASVRPWDAAGLRAADLMTRFEAMLTEPFGNPLRVSELCAALGVGEPALRASCADFLGMSPTRYLLLRRLRHARIALQDSNPGSVDLDALAHRLGFARMGPFTAAYRAAFGETPSATLQRAPRTRFATR